MLTQLEALPLPQRAWLIGLLIVWAALLFGELAARKLQRGRADRMPAQTRLLSSAALVGAGWSWALFSRNTVAANYAAWIATGMTLGCLGDLLMARLLPVRDYVLAGMAAFGLGHVAYITAGLGFAAAHGFHAAGLRFGAWGVWLFIGVLGWYLAVLRGQARTALHWVALPYALLLASTTGVATGLALQAAAFWPLAVGAALFLFSDLILAARLFAGAQIPHGDDVIWLTYGPGQMLIVYSSAAALALAQNLGG